MNKIKVFLITFVFTGVLSSNALAITAQELFDTSCSACHASGVLGAPKIGDKKEWKKRLKKGKAILVKNAIKGIGQMPAKGGRTDLPDSIIAKAVSIMLKSPNHKNSLAQKSKKRTKTPVVELLSLGDKYNFPTDENGYFLPPPLEDAPQDKYGDEVRLGYKIFTQTLKYAPRYSGRGLTCGNCHLDAGRKPNAVPMWGATGIYPIYRKESDKSDNLADRIQACFKASMNGFPPAHDAPEMRALLSYVHYISRGVPIGVNLPGRSIPDEGRFSLPLAGHEPSPNRGAIIYKEKCAVCHGKNGYGQRNKDGTYLYPPLWGLNSYNKSASLYKNGFLARFIWANMPFGQDFSLTPQEAWDVASYINIHERPKNPKTGVFTELFGK